MHTTFLPPQIWFLFGLFLIAAVVFAWAVTHRRWHHEDQPCLPAVTAFLSFAIGVTALAALLVLWILDLFTIIKTL